VVGDWWLVAVSHQSPVISHRPPVTDHQSPTASHPKQLQHFARLRVTPDLRFLEDRDAVAQYFESATSRGNELHLLRRKCVANLRRQTGGAGLVASDRAVFDRDHRLLIPSILANTHCSRCPPSVATRCGASLMSSAFQFASAFNTMA
jgi:hypothetical protein